MAELAESTPTLSRGKKRLFTLILVLLVWGVLELIASFYLRQFRGYDGHHLYQYTFDPYKNILPGPNYVDTRGVRHDRQGFRRSTDVSRDKAPGTYRIFLMGASTAYGLGGLWDHIEDRWPVLTNEQTIDAYLERDLKAALPGRNVEVINAAITSTWTHHSLIYLNQSILGYHPDMVLFMDGFNDYFITDPNHDQFADYSYGLESRTIMGDPTLPSLFFAVGWWLFRKDPLSHVIGRVARDVKVLLSPPHQGPPLNVDTEVAHLKQVFPQNALKMHRRSGLILRDEGVRAVFMLQPILALERNDKPMAGSEQKLLDFYLSSYRPGYEQMIQQAHVFVRDTETVMAGQVGAQYLDLTNTFTGVNAQIFTDYCHLTPLGNEMIAKRIEGSILPTIKGDRGW